MTQTRLDIIVSALLARVGRDRVAEDSLALRRRILAGDERGGYPGLGSPLIAAPEASNAVGFCDLGPVST